MIKVESNVNDIILWMIIIVKIILIIIVLKKLTLKFPSNSFS